MGGKSSKRPDALHDAIIRGDEGALRRLIREGADVNTWRPPLYEAMMLGKANCVKALLEAGADVNRPDSEGGLPVVVAATLGYLEYLQMFLEAGADVSRSRLAGGRQPLNFALLTLSHPRCAEMLVRAGADATRCEYNGNSALALAASGGHPGCVEAMLRAGAEVNRRDHTGRTPLSIVIYELERHSYTEMPTESYENYFVCFRLLLEAGAEVNVRGIRSVAPFRKELLGLLYVAGDDVGIGRLGLTAQNAYTQHPERRLCLRHLCRVVIRRRLMETSRVNLFYKAQRPPLPPVLQRHLVYNVSLNARDAKEALKALCTVENINDDPLI